eukprot:augustus_masked-scaffold_75-processed-gene-0.10-mRNA-1 protein AED:1.00 eAED:1.00 QI:0/-1/0/0/-1/1/1/0/68
MQMFKANEEGASDGFLVGEFVGLFIGWGEGDSDGLTEGVKVGEEVGFIEDEAEKNPTVPDPVAATAMP